MQDVQEKLATYQNFLEAKGYDQGNLEVILREKVDSFAEYDFGGKVIFPKKYDDFIPMGNPPSFMVGYGYENDRAYGMVFVSQDTAVSLKISGKIGNTQNPILFMDTINDVMRRILVETRDQVDVLETEYKEKETVLKLMEFVNIEGIDSVLYSFFTNSKVLILGKVDDAVELVRILLLLIPESLRNKSGFTINLPFIDDKAINFSIIDDVPQIDLEKEVETYLGYNIPVVNLYEKTCFGDFSCNYTRQLIEIIKTHNSIDNAVVLTKQIFDLATEVTEGESPQEFADRNNIAYDDADLILDITKNHGGY